jgi:spermidine synthase
MTQGPYHLFSVSILLVLGYLASLLASRIALLKAADHRRFWNTLLLIFFLSTGILGILLAVQVNYKLELAWAETALQWHVDLGIGFVTISIFHLTWHLGYFKKIAIRQEVSAGGEIRDPHLPFSSVQSRWLFLLLGFVSMMAQLLLLREFIKTLHGNELIIGIYLAIWMITTAVGAWAGAVYRVGLSATLLLKLMWSLSLIPLVIYLFLLLVDHLFFLPGYEPGMIASISYIALLIALFTLMSGFLFAYLAKSIRWKTAGTTYYLLDSLGSLSGGAVFSLLLVFFLDNLQVLVLLPLIASISLLLLFRFPEKRSHRVAILAGSLLLVLAGMFPGSGHMLEQLHYRNETVLLSKDTPYGNLAFTSKEGEVTGYLDRNPVLSSSDVTLAEETVHYPSLQRPDPTSFLLIGGGLAGNAAEIAKYHPAVFDYCEVDPDLYRFGRMHLQSDEPEVMQFRPVDGRKWLVRNSEATYDVIISAAGDPETLGRNRYYTIEFYRLVDAHLNEGGVFAVQLNTGGNYINDPGGTVIGMNYRTLNKVFDHVIIVPGLSTYFLASDQPLSLDFPELVRSHGIETIYVNSDYLDAMHLQFDSDQIMERIRQESTGLNSDLWPRLFFAELASLESRLGGHAMFITGLLSVLIFLTLILVYSPLKTGMYMTGFTGAGIQIVLILVLQSYYGFAYLAAPVMITLFMGGIVTGSKIWDRVWKGHSVAKFTGLVWIMALLAASLVILLKIEPLFEQRFAGKFILGCFNFLPGLIVGSVYGMSLELSREKTAAGRGLFYSADLAGAALGTFIPGLFIIPLIGVTNTFILFCGINAATGLYVMTRWR